MNLEPTMRPLIVAVVMTLTPSVSFACGGESCPISEPGTAVAAVVGLGLSWVATKLL